MASERDFYTFVRDDTGQVDYVNFEAVMNASERLFGDALASYLTGGSEIPTDTLKQRIALGVGFQMTRTGGPQDGPGLDTGARPRRHNPL